MGNFYVNFATRGPQHDAVVGFLRDAGRTAIVSPTVDQVTLFYDEEADTQDDQAIVSLASSASRQLRSPVLAFLNHDDDILAYWLATDGKVVDEYNSCPGYFDDGDDTPSGGDAHKLAAAFVSSKVDEIEQVLRDEDFTFALERHERLAGLLNLPWNYSSLGYGYIKQGDAEDDTENFTMIE